MNKNLKLIREFTHKNKVIYFTAIVFIACATFFSFICPLILRITIDSVIGKKPLDIFSFLQPAIDSVGGRLYLVNNIWLCSFVIVLVTLGNGLFSFLTRRLSAVASENIIRNIRNKIYDHIQKLPYKYHVTAETGDLIQRSTSDVETIRRFISMQFIEIGRSISMIAIAIPVMFRLNSRFAWIAVPVIPVLLFFSYIFYTKVQKAFKMSDEAEGKMSNMLQENLTGVRVVRAFGRQHYEEKKFDNHNGEFKDLTYRLIKLLAIYWAISDFLSMAQICLVLVCGSIFAFHGQITIGTLVVFLTYEGMLLWPIRQMGRILADMGKAKVSFNRIKEVLDNQPENLHGHFHCPQISGGIVFENVCFYYGNQHYVLRNISFNVEPGMTIALLGATGSGKTTLVHLLPRLYDYTSGSIRIDGVELKTIEKEWIRKHIGIVLQEPFLYSRSIHDNIGISVKNCSQEKIINVSKTAAIHDTIEKFEKGYHTLVGERGVTLSGGQKQRIAIARALSINSPILIFDDSLSAVDTETDATIREALTKRTTKVTTFIISHRVTTLMSADLIIVLEKGRISQIGNHNQLLEQDGLYKRIWKIQNVLESELEKEMEGHIYERV